MKQNNLLVGQSGGPTCAINATLAGILQGAAREFPQSRIYGMLHGIVGVLEDRLTDLTELSRNPKTLDLLRVTPAAALGSCRHRLNSDPAHPDYDLLLERFRQYGIGTVFYIGGNDSMDTVAKLAPRAAREGICVLGVPKTIDNDLTGTDHTPGFGSAAKYVATSLSEIACDCAVYRTRAVTVTEVMGRDAGWLTAAAGLPRLIGEPTADLIYLPETPFRFESFLEEVENIFSQKPSVTVAVSEGIRFADGTYVGSDNRQRVDAFGHVRLAGAANVLTDFLSRRLGCKTRGIELNLPQRCAAHLLSETDISESVRIGQAAVAVARVGQSGQMLSFRRVSNVPYTVEIGTVPAEQVANRVRAVPEEWLAPAGEVSPQLLMQIAPLIRGEVSLPRKDGLPVHFLLEREIK